MEWLGLQYTKYNSISFTQGDKRITLEETFKFNMFVSVNEVRENLYILDILFVNVDTNDIVQIRTYEYVSFLAYVQRIQKGVPI